MSSSDNLHAFICKLDEDIDKSSLVFPVCSDITLRLNKLLEDPNYKISELADLVKVDPVLISKLNTIAKLEAIKKNASAINSIEDMIRIVGINVFRFIIISTIKEQILREITNYELRQLGSNLWLHTMDVGCWSYALAKTTGLINPEKAMLSAILSSMGLFYLISKAEDFPILKYKDDLYYYSYEINNKLLNIYGFENEIIDALYSLKNKRIYYPINRLSDIISLGMVATSIENPLSNDNISIATLVKTKRSSTEFLLVELLIKNATNDREIMFREINKV